MMVFVVLFPNLWHIECAKVRKYKELRLDLLFINRLLMRPAMGG